MMRIIHNEKCWQCEQVKEEIVDVCFGKTYTSGQFRLCEDCIDNYIEGRIKFVDAHEAG